MDKEEMLEVYENGIKLINSLVGGEMIDDKLVNALETLSTTYIEIKTHCNDDLTRRSRY